MNCLKDPYGYQATKLIKEQQDADKEANKKASEQFSSVLFWLALGILLVGLAIVVIVIIAS